MIHKRKDPNSILVSQKSAGKPTNITLDAEHIMGETGLRWMTTDNNLDNTIEYLPDGNKTTPDNMSPAALDWAREHTTDLEELRSLPEDNASRENTKRRDFEDNKMLGKQFPPEVIYEQESAGSTPDPESDDDSLENVHAMGIALDEDREHPKPLDIAEDVDEAEEYILEH